MGLVSSYSITMTNKNVFMGRHCLLELLKFAPRKIRKVYLAKEDRDLEEDLRRANVPIKRARKEQLTSMVSSDSHQGIVGEIEQNHSLPLKEFLEKSPDQSVVIMLDSIFDPQNLGAIFRLAECFGVDAVVFSKNRGASITPTVRKVSSGASELITTIQVSNLAESIKRFQDAGYQAIVSDVSEKATSLLSFQFPEKSLIIMGSEGKGVQPLITKRADHLVTIPMKGQISSLNVSTATSVFLTAYSICK